MKRTIEMTHTKKEGRTAIITCETISNGNAPEYSEGTRTILIPDFDPIATTFRNDEPGPVFDQVYNWIGYLHFQGYTITKNEIDY